MTKLRPWVQFRSFPNSLTLTRFSIWTHFRNRHTKMFITLLSGTFMHIYIYIWYHVCHVWKFVFTYCNRSSSSNSSTIIWKLIPKVLISNYASNLKLFRENTYDKKHSLSIYVANYDLCMSPNNEYLNLLVIRSQKYYEING